MDFLEKTRCRVNRFTRHLDFGPPDPLQDALLAAAGCPVRFDGKSAFPRGHRRYHEVNRERASGRSGAQHWAARGMGPGSGLNGGCYGNRKNI